MLSLCPFCGSGPGHPLGGIRSYWAGPDGSMSADPGATGPAGWKGWLSCPFPCGRLQVRARKNNSWVLFQLPGVLRSGWPSGDRLVGFGRGYRSGLLRPAAKIEGLGTVRVAPGHLGRAGPEWGPRDLPAALAAFVREALAAEVLSC